jgi:hypothetical protein
VETNPANHVGIFQHSSGCCKEEGGPRLHRPAHVPFDRTCPLILQPSQSMHTETLIFRSHCCHIPTPRLQQQVTLLVSRFNVALYSHACFVELQWVLFNEQA